ncbi:LAMI_0E15698g1_1 [Lachancea mirantina]|uniref:LAMI_0E15698g1_1 n=1 Tax=Lachancea mirantina TaxID=1230905 RepID=A0A1G4JSI0_9SACH|nr:LAMI_0E15698g1_1 [Lachancea mirantina]
MASKLAFWLIWTLATAAPITFELKAGFRECFYLLTPDIDCKISYYFAVQRGDENKLSVNYEIYKPDNRDKAAVVRKGETQGQWSFIGEHKGEYGLCFSSGDEGNKIIDVEFKYDEKFTSRDKRRKKHFPQGLFGQDPLHESLEDSIDDIERHMSVLERKLDHYKARSIRNQQTVMSTGKRIVGFSLYGILLVVVMGVAQCLVLQAFFNEARKYAV